MLNKVHKLSNFIINFSCHSFFNFSIRYCIVYKRFVWLALKSPRFLQLSLVAIFAKTFTMVASVLVRAFGCVWLEDASFKATVFTHAHCIWFFDFAILSQVMRAVIFEIIFVFLHLLEKLVITHFTQALSSIYFAKMTT